MNFDLRTPIESHCTCRHGRDSDGSEFGPCEHCERLHDEDAVRRAIVCDASRWRISQSRGYFFVRRDYCVEVGIQPHPVTKATILNHCIMGRGNDEGAAIDGMFKSLSAYVAEGAFLPEDIDEIRLLFDEAMQECAQ